MRGWHEYDKIRCEECTSPGRYAFNALEMIANGNLATYLESNLSPWVFDWKPSIQLSVMRQRRSPLSKKWSIQMTSQKKPQDGKVRRWNPSGMPDFPELSVMNRVTSQSWSPEFQQRCR